MKFFTLFSGSSGNSLYVESGQTRILVDAGKNMKAVQAALSQKDTSLSDISAIFLTHSHSDHISAVPVIAGNYGMPIFARSQVLDTLVEKGGIMPSRLTALNGDGPFAVGDIKVTAFETPHDSPGSVGYRIADGDGKSLVIATDLGHITDRIYSELKKSVFAIVEANYDPEMLENGPYPYILKMRVGGMNGHLSNGDCAYAICRLAESGVRHFMLAHISENNNTPSVAANEVIAALTAAGYTPGEVTLNIAPRHDVSDTFVL